MNHLTFKVRLTALILVLITALSAFSCGSKDEPVKLTNVFKSEIVEMPQIFDYVNNMQYAADRVYMFGYDRENYRSTIYTMKTDGSDGYKIDFSLDETKNESLGNTAILSDGTFIITVNSWFENTETGEFTENIMLCHCAADGSVISSRNIKDVVKPKNEGDYVYINYIVSDGNGNIYLVYMNTVYVVDSSFNELARFELEADYIDKLLYDPKGYLIVFYYDNIDYKQQAKKIDAKTGEILGDYTLDTLAKNNYYNMKASQSPDSTYELFFQSNTGICGFDADTGVSTELLNWINSDINSNYINQYIMLDDDKALCYSFDYRDSESELIVLTRIPDEELVPKTVLTLACYYLDYDVREEIIDYNRRNDSYRIQVVDYSEYNSEDDYEAGITKFNNDIISGKIPDIMVLNSQLPYENYAARGLFTDMYELLESDPELKKEDFLENILDAMSIEGKLFMVAPQFSIQTYAIKTKFVGDKKSLTMKEFREVVDKVKAEKGDVMVFQDATRDSLLNSAVMVNYDRFVDKNTGKCYFDSEDFIEVLKFANELDTKSFWENINYDELDEQFWLDLETVFRDDKCLVQPIYLSGYSNYWRIMKGQFGEEITLIGFPTDSGNGSAVEIGTSFAISSRTKHKDAAWQFVRHYLTDDYQMSLTYNFPIKRTALEECARQESTMPELDENGYPIYKEGVRVPSTYYYIGNEEIEIGVITQEYINKLNEFIGSVNRVVRYNNSVNEIITEEAGMYFEGVKSAEEVASLIQNRVSIYVNENR